MTRTGRRPAVFAPAYTEPRRKYACTSRNHKPSWVVVTRNGNYSAFNGYHFTPSDYSLVKCRSCDALWRTKAGYVAGLPDAPNGAT